MSTQDRGFYFLPPNERKVIEDHLYELNNIVMSGKGQEYIYNHIQKMFLLEEQFDKAMIWFFRSAISDFLMKHRDLSMNGLPLEFCPIVEEPERGATLELYIQNIVNKMNEDAQGFLLFIAPIVLRINIYIVNIDTSPAARVRFVLNVIEWIKKHY